MMKLNKKNRIEEFIQSGFFLMKQWLIELFY